MRSDTHIHSVFSDGTYTPEEIVQIAKEENLDLIALTDHNTVDGIPQFHDSVKNHSLKALAGCEVTTGFSNREVHIPAYFPIDTDFTLPQYHDFISMIERNRQRKIESKKITLDKISKSYPEASFQGFIEYIDNHKENHRDISRRQIADYLVYKGIASDRKEALNGILKKGGEYHTPTEKDDIRYTLDVIVKCGGFPTVAHMAKYQPQLSDSDLHDMLVMISSITGCFGVEIFHFKHKPEDIDRYIQMCESIDADIVYMAGADCHGTKKPNRIGYPYDFEIDERYMALYQDISGKAVEFFKGKGWI